MRRFRLVHHSRCTASALEARNYVAASTWSVLTINDDGDGDDDDTDDEDDDDARDLDDQPGRAVPLGSALSGGGRGAYGTPGEQ